MTSAEKYAELEALGQSRPVCKCHGVTMRWRCVTGRRSGGNWRCVVADMVRQKEARATYALPLRECALHTCDATFKPVQKTQKFCCPKHQRQAWDRHDPATDNPAEEQHD